MSDASMKPEGVPSLTDTEKGAQRTWAQIDEEHRLEKVHPPEPWPDPPVDELPPPVEVETAWLIEIPGPAWWDGRGQRTFTTDPGEALRLARREDAERLLSWKVVLPPPGEVRITEHEWIHPAGQAEGR